MRNLGLFLQTERYAGYVASTAPSQADLTGVSYLLPIFAFLVVGIIAFALLRKFKMLGDYPFIDALVALFISAIFVTAVGVRTLILTVIPWFAVLLFALFCILMLVNFIGKSDIAGKGMGWFFVIMMLLIFVVAAIKLFAGTIFPYMPGPAFGSSPNSDPQLLYFFSWLYSPRIAGSLWLIVAAIAVSWVLIKFSGKK